MKKQLIIIFTSLVFLAGTQLSAETVSWEEDNRVIKVIDGTIMIDHEIGHNILGEYKKNLDMKGSKIYIDLIQGRISYGQGLNQPEFNGYVITLPSESGEKAGIYGEGYGINIKNITTADAFEKEAQQWAKTQLAKTLFNIPANNPNHATIEKELTNIFQETIKKWKDLIVIFKADAAEQLQNAQKKDDKSPVHATLEKDKDQLTTLNKQLANFK